MAATSQLSTARAILNARPASTPWGGIGMGVDYYSADTENGDHTDDPSEDGLFLLLTQAAASSTATDPSDIARDLTIWLAARHYPGRPARSNTDF